MQDGQFTIVDTKDLQIKSLLDFAETLGYVPVYRTRLSRGFVTKVDKKYRHVSFENMTKGYNNFLPSDGKLVEKVKLQRDRKEPDGVKCQNHMIRLTPRGEEFYTHLRSL